MRAPRTAGEWSAAIAWALDGLALAALAATGEIASAFVLAVAAGALLAAGARLGRVRPLGSRTLLPLLGAIVAAGVFALLRFKVHPVIVAAHAAPLAHAALWFGPRDDRYRGWRLGMGLLELTLASAMTVDVYLPAAIALFVLLASVGISCGFLNRELRTRAPERADDPLPPTFVARSVSTSFLVLLTSIAIFPLIPRARGTLPIGGFGPATTGYTERVTMSDPSRTPEGGRTLLRLFPADDADLTTEIYLGLIRARTLDKFDGTEWRPLPPGLLRSPRHRPASAARRLRVEVVREAIGSDTLPVPYFTVGLQSADLVRDTVATLPSGEWLIAGSHARRQTYSVDLAFDPASETEARRWEKPGAVHLEVPGKLALGPLASLSARIFANTRSAAARVRAVSSYFHQEGLSGAIETPELQMPASRLHPIVDFLFVRKEGQCEMFASAAATLLRLAGVPTRLVAGFRLTRNPIGGVLVLRSDDAHAWVEYWAEDRGWQPFDPTPRIIAGASLWAALRDGYDWMSAQWYRKVVTYGEEGRSPWTADASLTARLGELGDWLRSSGAGFPSRGLLATAATAVALAVVLGALGIGVLRRLRSGPTGRTGPIPQARGRSLLRGLLRERDRMDRWLARGGPGSAAWETLYLSLRFGPPVPTLVAERGIEKLRGLRLRLAHPR